jgi:protein SCO1/2
MTFSASSITSRIARRAAGPVAALAIACSAAPASSAAAQGAYGGTYRPPTPTTEPVPELEGVTIREVVDARLPLDTVLTRENGKVVTLRDVLPTDRPAILQIGYMRCPQLCGLVMNALVRGLQGVDWTVGEEFDVICLSIDPTERPALAAAKKAGYVAEYGRGESGAGWHFLTGDAANVHAVADSVGFEYRKQENGEYSHAAAVFMITPDGRLSRVLYGVKYEPATIRMGLLEASEGKIGSTLDRIILWCHVYDANTGGYVLFALNMMKLGGAITVLVLGGGLGWLWWRDSTRRRLSPPGSDALTNTH